MSRVRIGVALGAAALCVIAAVQSTTVAEAIVDVIAIAVLAAVTVTDLERRIIPNRIVLPALVAALAVQSLRDPGLEWVISAAGAGVFFFAMALAYPAGLGMGDVKLAAALGAWLGRDVAVGLFLGSVLAMLPAVVILFRHGSAGRKVGIPFAPFLALGAVLARFFGDDLTDLWLG